MSISFIAATESTQHPGDVDIDIVAPDPIQDGDILFLQFGHINSSSQKLAVYSVSSSWVAISAPDRVSAFRRWLYYRFVSSGFGGTTVNIGVSGGIPTGFQSASIYQIRGVSSDVYESIGRLSGLSITLSDVAVTTTGPNEMACNFFMVAHNTNFTGLAGETGGTWTIAEQSELNDPRIFLEVSTLTTATTIDGGSWNIDDSSAWLNLGLALLPLATQIDINTSGLSSGSDFGNSPTIITPTLL